jgi:hypothetical protein
MSKLMQKAIIAIVLAGSGLLGLAAPKGAAPQAQSTVWRSYTNANYVNGLAFDGDAVWAATSGGVVRWNRADGTYVKYTTLDGLSGNQVSSLAIDAAGHKWFGTDGGVSQFDGQRWTTYTTNGVANNCVFAIPIDQEGHKWFGTSAGIAASTQVLLVPGSGVVMLGQTIAVEVRLQNVTDLYGVEIRLNFEATKLQVQDADGDSGNGVQIEEGNFPDPAQGFVVRNSADNSTGQVDYAVALWAPASAVSGSGVTARITFLGIAPGISPLNLTATLSDDRGQPIPATVTGGHISVSAGTDTPTATATRTETPVMTATRTGTRTATPTGTPGVGHLFLPVIVRAHRPPCDPYERNDDCWYAYGPLRFGLSYEAYICAGDPQDWYFIDLDAAERITIDLTVPAVADYELFLYDRCGEDETVARSVNTGDGEHEHIAYDATPGRYHIRVYPATPDDHTGVHPYVLEVHR